MMIFGDDYTNAVVAENLHPDLIRHVIQGSVLEMVHHPLIIAPLSAGRAFARVINMGYVQKKKDLAQAIAGKDYHRIIMLHERPYRFDAMMMAINDLGMSDHEDYWTIVGQVWTDSENIHASIEGWRAIWGSAIPARHTAMTRGDDHALRSMSETIRVYRGYDADQGTPEGLSWTLDRTKAEWFSLRFGGTPAVVSGTVRRASVLAHFANRSEAEIVVLPEDVRDVTPG